MVESARRGHAVDPRHHHVEKIEREALPLRLFQKRVRVRERSVSHGRLMRRLPTAQKFFHALQLLRPIVANGNVHGSFLPFAVSFPSQFNSLLWFYFSIIMLQNEAAEISAIQMRPFAFLWRARGAGRATHRRRRVKSIERR